MRGHHHVARLLAAAFHHIDLGRPAAVVGEHPERRPYRGAGGNLGADFEVAVFLRERALRRQDAGRVFVVEQHVAQLWRRARRDDRQHPVTYLERIKPERCGLAAAIARIDIDLLLAVPCRLAPEVGAIAAPVARFRPGRTAGIVRRPFSPRQRVLVEIVVEGPVQFDRREQRILRIDAPALFAGGIASNHQRDLRWRRPLHLLRRYGVGCQNGGDDRQHARLQVVLVHFTMNGCCIWWGTIMASQCLAKHRTVRRKGDGDLPGSSLQARYPNCFRKRPS